MLCLVFPLLTVVARNVKSNHKTKMNLAFFSCDFGSSLVLGTYEHQLWPRGNKLYKLNISLKLND